MKWEITSIEQLIPYEFEIYTNMLKEMLENRDKNDDGGYDEMMRQGY